MNAFVAWVGVTGLQFKTNNYQISHLYIMQQSSFQVHDFIMINYYTFGVMRVGLLLHDLDSLSDKCFLINKV